MPVLQGNIYIYNHSVDFIKLSVERPVGWFTDYYLIKNRTILVYSDNSPVSSWIGLTDHRNVTYEFAYGQVQVPTSFSETNLQDTLLTWIYNLTGGGGGKEDVLPPILMLMGG